MGVAACGTFTARQALCPRPAAALFVSHGKLDEHVIFQALALYLPNDSATYLPRGAAQEWQGRPPVKGIQNVDVKGYLAAWVPGTQVQE
jgi:hypothetical protein